VIVFHKIAYIVVAIIHPPDYSYSNIVPLNSFMHRPSLMNERSGVLT